MPRASAPRVRVVLSVDQQRARVRGLAYGAAVAGVLAVVLVVVALRAEGWAAGLALAAAVVPAAVAVLAARTALVLRGLRAPAPHRTPRAGASRPGAKLPVNLGRAEREAAVPSDGGPAESPSGPA